MWWEKEIKKSKIQNVGEFFSLKTLNMQREILQMFATVQYLHFKI
jgi:hypothetical protein